MNPSHEGRVGLAGLAPLEAFQTDRRIVSGLGWAETSEFTGVKKGGTVGEISPLWGEIFLF